MTIPCSALRVLAAISDRRLAIVVQRLASPRGRRPALGTNAAVPRVARLRRASHQPHVSRARRGLADPLIPTSSVHRVVATLVPRLAALAGADAIHDRRRTWILDGTLIPTRDHGSAARFKNDRWSCNAQLLVRHRDLVVVATTAGGPGNRNDPAHYRGSAIERLAREHGRVLADGGYRGIAELVTPRFRNNRIVRDYRWRRHSKRRARVEHTIARLKNWRVLRDHRRRGRHLANTVAAVAFLHNLQIEMRDNP